MKKLKVFKRFVLIFSIVLCADCICFGEERATETYIKRSLLDGSSQEIVVSAPESKAPPKESSSSQSESSAERSEARFASAERSEARSTQAAESSAAQQSTADQDVIEFDPNKVVVLPRPKEFEVVPPYDFSSIPELAKDLADLKKEIAETENLSDPPEEEAETSSGSAFFSAETLQKYFSYWVDFSIQLKFGIILVALSFLIFGYYVVAVALNALLRLLRFFKARYMKRKQLRADAAKQRRDLQRKRFVVQELRIRREKKRSLEKEKKRLAERKKEAEEKQRLLEEQRQLEELQKKTSEAQRQLELEEQQRKAEEAAREAQEKLEKEQAEKREKEQQALAEQKKHSELETAQASASQTEADLAAKKSLEETATSEISDKPAEVEAKPTSLRSAEASAESKSLKKLQSLEDELSKFL